MEDGLAGASTASVSHSSDGSHCTISCGSTRRYLCSACPATRSKRSLIEAHIRSHLPEQEASFSILGTDSRRYTCPVCGTARSKFALLQKHMREHASTEESSNDCPSVTSSVPAKKRKFLECEQCGYLTKKQSILHQHRVSHSSELHWQCTRAVPRRVTSQEVLVAPSCR